MSTTLPARVLDDLDEVEARLADALAVVCSLAPHASGPATVEGQYIRLLQGVVQTAEVARKFRAALIEIAEGEGQ